MDRLKGALALIVTAGAFVLVLRLLHLVVPAFYPSVLSGPFSVQELSQVGEFAGFSPRIPFYHPMPLGSKPVNITVVRRPRATVTVFWHAERFLYLSERHGGAAPVPPPNAKPLAGIPDAWQWREGETHHAIVPSGDLWIELRTDLPERDVERVVVSLQPYEKAL